MERTLEEIEQKNEWDHYAILQTAKRDGERKGLKTGLKTGLEKGHKKGVIEVAKNLKLQGTSIAAIQAATKLSVSEIESL